MKITIRKQKYELKYKLRNYFAFETIAGYPFKPGKLVDEYLLFYSILVANNETFKMTFEELIEECDKNPSLFLSFSEWFAKEVELQAQLIQAGDIKKKGVAQA